MPVRTAQSDAEIADESARVIAAMQAMVDVAPEPGTLRPRDVLHTGDLDGPDTPVPLIAHRVASAGYVYIYDTRTGERSLTNRNMLEAQRQKKREDGSYVFTLVRPAQLPERGTLKCPLHTESTERARYDALGFGTCRKSNLVSPLQVRRHMQNRHKTEWATMEEERLTREKEEDRALQRSILAGLAAQAGVKK